MRALLLSAGFGTRLRPLTKFIPKCLVPINGKPLMDYWLKMLFDADIKEVLVNLHYLPEKVKTYLDSSPYSEFVKTVYEKELLGTGGTLLKNRNFFQNEDILLIHADNLSIFDMDEFIRAHKKRPATCEITMMTFKSEIPQDCGIVELDKNNVVCSFHEKVLNPPGNLANGAVYILDPSVLNFLKRFKNKKIDFSKEILPSYLGRIYTFHNNEYHRDIGTIDSYCKAKKDFCNQN